MSHRVGQPTPSVSSEALKKTLKRGAFILVALVLFGWLWRECSGGDGTPSSGVADTTSIRNPVAQAAVDVINGYDGWMRRNREVRFGDPHPLPVGIVTETIPIEEGDVFNVETNAVCWLGLRAENGRDTSWVRFPAGTTRIRGTGGPRWVIPARGTRSGGWIVFRRVG